MPSQMKKIPNGSITPSTSQPTFCQCGAFDVSPIKYSTVNITTHNAEAKNSLETSGEINQSSLINALGSTLGKTDLMVGKPFSGLPRTLEAVARSVEVADQRLLGHSVPPLLLQLRPSSSPSCVHGVRMSHE